MRNPNSNSILQSRISLVDELANVLRERIVNGAYDPGSWLRQERLAEEFDVSRTPLREALRVLEREGLIVVRPGRGARVVSGDMRTHLAAYEVREVIDGLAARLAAENRTAALVSQLEREVANQQRSLDPWKPTTYTSRNISFHSRIIRASGNEFLEVQLPLVAMTSRVFTPTRLMRRERAETAVVEHVAIVQAIASGDGVEAERVARGHIHRTRTELAQSWGH